MKLYLLRHGQAGERGDPRYPDDRLRPLTPEGRRQMRRIAAGMRAAGVKFEVLLSSPYVRARQTAEIVAETFRARRKLVLADELTPEGDARALIRLLEREYAGAESILLAGHEPYLGELAGWLLAGGRNGLALALKKGGLCRLTVDRLSAGSCLRLDWLLTPRLLERLGR